MRGGVGFRLELPRATVGMSRWRRFRAAVDWPLIVTILALCAIGLLNLYSATRGVKHHAKFDTQVQWMIVGAIGFVVVTVVDYRVLVRLAWIGLGLAIALLVVARLTGKPASADINHGLTYRWLNFGGMGIQPSELVKLMFVLVLARLFASTEPNQPDGWWSSPRLFGIKCALLVIPAVLIPLRPDIGTAVLALMLLAAGFLAMPRTLGLKFGLLFVPILLIAIQPDLGTAVLLSLMLFTVGFLAMPNVWPMVYITAGALVAIPDLWEKLHGYQKDRILGFIDCNSQPVHSIADKLLRDTCWHTQQSIYAVGSGKVWGKGFLGGTQNQFNFVPEHWTDFPYCVWAEEWGFVGSVFLLAIFSFLLVWILNVALSARDRVGSVICIGVAAMTFWHVAVNIAMVLGLAPVVGVTLPFISYGGSSLVTFFLAMGLVANVSLRKHGY